MMQHGIAYVFSFEEIGYAMGIIITAK